MLNWVRKLCEGLVLASFCILLPSIGQVKDAIGQDTVTVSFPGGYIRLPGQVTIPIDTVTRIDTVFVSDTVEVCPEGWECIPPPEPEPTVELVRQDSGVVVPGGSVRIVLAMDTTEATRTRVVEFFLNGVSVRNEYAYRYCLGGGDGVPCNPQTIPTDAMEAIVEAKRYLRDGSPVETYTLEIPINPTEPPEPPDSTPPAPGDSIIGTIPLGTPQNIQLVWDTTGKWLFDWDAIPEDTVTTCVSCGTWWERTAVVNDDDVVGDEIYYTVGAWSGDLPYNPEASWQFDGETLAPDSRYIADRYLPLPDTVSVCVRAEAWDAPGYEGPGGFIRYPPANIITPISEVNCTTIATQSP